MWVSWAPGVRPPSRARPTWDFQGTDRRNAPPRLSETSHVFRELPEKKWKQRRQQPCGGRRGSPGPRSLPAPPLPACPPPQPAPCAPGNGELLGAAQTAATVGQWPRGPSRQQRDLTGRPGALEASGHFLLKDSLSVHWDRTAMPVPCSRSTRGPRVHSGRCSKTEKQDSPAQGPGALATPPQLSPKLNRAARTFPN